MDLPKNITQIGEPSDNHKVYIEDYAMSHMKQLNRGAQEKTVIAALYGNQYEENDIFYYFVYGACKVDSIGREVKHLSSAQHQEIERIRRRHFGEYIFLGYSILDGEMPEGFYLLIQGACKYLAGYCQFYEKNESMLSYMLAVNEKPEPEQIENSKYEAVRQRQDKLRRESEERVGALTGQRPEAGFHTIPSVRLMKMRYGAAFTFAVLCLLGVATFRDNTIQSDSLPSVSAVNSAGVTATPSVSVEPAKVPDLNESSKDVLVMEGKLEKALLDENKTSDNIEETETKETGIKEIESQIEQQAELPEQEASQKVEESPKAEEAQKTEEAVAYVVQPGDTLISISKRQYGTEVRVKDICAANKINNPDEIKQGQVILLPQ